MLETCSSGLEIYTNDYQRFKTKLENEYFSHKVTLMLLTFLYLCWPHIII